jgi:hypothetical protein
MRRAFALLLFVIVGSACSKSNSGPTSPDTTPTRVISIAGDLNFGNVSLIQAKNAGFTIANVGNSVLTVTSFTGPCANTGFFKFTWTAGTIEAGAAQPVIVTFAPKGPITCTGPVTVHGDQTSGGDTIALTAVGVVPGAP